MDFRTWVQSLPKAELHLHIEGTLEPDLMFALAQKNKINIPYENPDDIRNAYEFQDLQSFLDIYYQGASVLRTAEDFYELAMDYYARAHHDGVVKSEIFFDPQTHTDRGIPMAVVMDGLTNARDEAKKRWGLESGLILCFLRHLSEDQAFETLHQALPHRDHILAFGLDSSELGHPPVKFKRVFDEVRRYGFPVVAHAGEEGPAEYIWQALNDLGAFRIDHGVRCLEDPRLVDHLGEKQTPLTVCPLSNIKLKVFDSLVNHPLKTKLDAGLNVCVNSDDPAYFGGYIVDNIMESAQALHLSENEVRRLCENSLKSCLI